MEKTVKPTVNPAEAVVVTPPVTPVVPATVAPTPIPAQEVVTPPVVPPVVPPNTPEPQPAVRFRVHEKETAHISSGLHGTIAQYLEPDYIKEIETLPEMDRLKLTEFFNKADWKPEELTGMDLGDASTLKMKSLFPEAFPTNGDAGGEPPDTVLPEVVLPESGKLEDMEKEELIIEYKKQKSDLDLQYKTLKEEFDTFKLNTPGEESVVLKDFEGLKTDFIGTYEKLQKKYGLPAIDLVRTQVTSDNSVSSRLQQYQETELQKIIEKEFGLQPDEFDYEANEASKAGTASYRWDELSNNRRESLIAEQRNLAKREVDMADKATEQQDLDTKWYADKYYEGDIAKVTEKLDAMNVVASAVSKGEESYEKHPFALRNLLHGYFHEELLTAAVQKAVDQLAQQFAQKGMYLGGEQLPTDPTKIATPPPTHEVISKEEAAKNPMLRGIGMTLNQLNQ